MNFEFEITVRSESGRPADFGRALERTAFFPGVTCARILDRQADFITIGYNGRRATGALRDFGAELCAEGLVADVAFWTPRTGDANHRFPRLPRA